MNGITCCYNCTDRVVGCHGTCKKYIDERAKYDETKARKNKDIAINGCLNHLTANKFMAIRNGRKEI